MKAICDITDLEHFVILNKNTEVLITPEFNITLGKASFPTNLHATSEEMHLTFKVHEISDLMLKNGITVDVANGLEVLK